MRCWIVLCLAATMGLAAPASARADSCWLHNGSLMRLTADGDGRSVYCESREASRHCTGTGVITSDTLVFTCSHQC